MNEEQGSNMPSGVGSTAPVAPAAPVTPAGRLPGVTTLFSESWNLYKAKFKSSVLLQLLNLVIWVAFFAVIALGGFALAGFGANPVTVILAIIVGLAMVIAGFIAAIWIQAGQIFVFDMAPGEVSVKSAMEKAKPLLKPFFVVMILHVLVVMGASILLIIPGIIFSVFLTFTAYTTLLEGHRGFDALLVSKEYVRGYWWAVLGRVVLLMIVAIVLFMVLGIITAMIDPSGNGIGAFITNLVNLVVTPFFVAYTYVLYKQFKTLKPNVTVPAEGRSTLKILAVIGPIAIILLVVGVFTFAFSQRFSENYRPASSIDQQIDFENLNIEDLEQFENMTVPAGEAPDPSLPLEVQ